MNKDDSRAARMAAYEIKRRAALEAIKSVRGQSNPDSLPLSEVIALMPDHPEWNEYRAAGRRARRKR